MTTLVPFLPELDFKQTSVIERDNSQYKQYHTEGIDKQPVLYAEKKNGLVKNSDMIAAMLFSHLLYLFLG